jgi:hypothetical protein
LRHCRCFSPKVLGPPLLEAVQRPEHLFAQERHLLPGFRELDALAARLEHGRTDEFREFSQQPGDGGLGESQLVGRARDAAQAQAGFEGDELGEKSVPEIPAQAVSGHVGAPLVRQPKVSLTNRAPARFADRAGAEARIDDAIAKATPL